MIPYDMETLRGMRATNAEVRRFAALEYRGADREWAVRESGGVRKRSRPAAWWAAVVAYLSLR
jgi:hypothetical protein